MPNLRKGSEKDVTGYVGVKRVKMDRGVRNKGNKMGIRIGNNGRRWAGGAPKGKDMA
jgi:hypothetical protein